ncbi:hypothetical protein [Streptococcus sobrinus]|uniref:hypothetical protein n=1 Tax=Streptococcus sobrinus TaxID=1310 RepID=UPI0002FEF637|nr:hypothetical protein [Streptococcus sobrinus]OZV23715.1 hypothetical protein RO09_04415 [Streptococcus sobrinus]
MKPSELSSKALRFIRLGGVLLGFIVANFVLILIGNKGPVWLSVCLGILTLGSFSLAYISYKELKDRPVAEQQFSPTQTIVTLVIIGFLILLICVYRAITDPDMTERIALIIVSILLVLTIIWNLLYLIKLLKKDKS